jgi:hypothetical protein
MANNYKMKDEFDAFAATVKQITLLQPNFIKVWEFQAHNETYNVSVEYDHYKMRYEWVKKGTIMLMQGTRFNRKDTRLLNYLSWFFGQKFGRADEYKQFRRLFREDKDFFAELSQPELMGPAIDDPRLRDPNNKRDNWLVGHHWQLRALDVVAAGAPIRGKSPVLFHSDAPMLRINYCRAIEEEGILDQNSQDAWEAARLEFLAFGNHPIPTTWGEEIRLQMMEDEVAQLQQLEAEIDKLAPGMRDQIQAEKLALLRPSERAALDTPSDKRTTEQHQIVFSIESEGRTAVNVDELAERVPAEQRREAKQLARRYNEKAETINRIDRYRNIVNYSYWRTRCEIEKTDTAIAARKNMFDAEKKFADGKLEQAGDVPGAKEHYEESFRHWAKIYEKHPDLRTDVEADIVVEAVERYMAVLKALDINNLPDDFPLHDLLQAQNKVPSGAKLKTAPPQTEPPKVEESKGKVEEKVEEKVEDTQGPKSKGQAPNNGKLEKAND